MEGLRVPLYSLRVHRRLPNCGHHADNDGFRVCFPTFDIEVDDEVDSYLTYEPAPASPDEVFDYVEPTAAEIAQARASASNTTSDEQPELRRSQRLIEKEKKCLKNRERKQQKKSKKNGAAAPSWSDVVSQKHDAEFDAQDGNYEELEETPPQHGGGRPRRRMRRRPRRRLRQGLRPPSKL